MKKEFDLLALGEVLLRLSPVNDDRLVRGDTFEKRVGGAELNVLTGASLLGLRTGIISRLPDNDIGKYAKNAIRFSGVSDDYLAYDSSKDARLGIYYYESGLYPRKPRVVYDRAYSSFQKISIDDFDDSIFESARCFHTSGITLALCPESRATAIEMIKRFKAAGAMISFDVNFRGNLWSGDEARACIETILPYVDIFFCSEDTARLTFLKEGTAEEIMKSFTEEYPISVVASTQRVVHSPRHHDFGSVIYSKATDTYYKEEPYKRIQVIDRIGSGDSYVGGVLYALLSEPDNFQRAVEFGNAYSAVKNTVRGDMPLSGCDEIESVIRDHKSTGYQSEMSR
jgi:2-dehydro-3-deoxygluconokinase